MRFWRWSAICLLASTLVAAAPAGTVTGEFQAGKRAPIRPKYAAAYEGREQRDARKKSIAVVLSEAPVDLGPVVAALDPYTELINQPALMKHNYVLVWVRPDGEVTMNAAYVDGMAQFMDRTTMSLKAELSANAPDKVAGRIYTSAPVKAVNGETWSVNLTFSSAVTRLPAGAPLPAGGGEPGKALGALLGAMSQKNWDGILRNLSEERRKWFDKADQPVKEKLGSALSMLQGWLPKGKPTITGGQLRGTTADIEVEDAGDFGKTLYLVRMVKPGAQWLYEQSTVVGYIQ